MGSIFKKIKKTVSKIKNPLGKLFKKVSKSISKIGGKVWKGIKDLGVKAYTAYGKISKKLGPIGMIGMSIAMPYLLGAFSGVGGGLWTNFGTMMGGTTKAGVQFGLQASKNPFFSILGRAGKGIYNTGNFIGGTTRGITQTISKTLEGFMGVKDGAKGSITKGFSNFFKGTSDVISGKAGMGTGKFLDIGGVALGNTNVANKFYFDVQKNIMKDQIYGNAAKNITGLSKDALQYHRTVVNQLGVDHKTAYDYIQRNGVDALGNFDITGSLDFQPAGIGGGYEWTGKELAKSSQGIANLETGAGYKWSPVEKGEIYQTQESILAKQAKKIKWKKNVAQSMISALNTDEDAPITYPLTKQSTDFNQVDTNWLGSNVSYAAMGGATTDEFKKWQSMLAQRKGMDIIPK